MGSLRYPACLLPHPQGSLKVSVSGEQWWWRIRYEMPEDEAVVLANEIRLPVGEPIEFRLDSPMLFTPFGFRRWAAKWI